MIDPTQLFYADALGAPLTVEMVAAAQQSLGYRLPQAYVDLMYQHNGGALKKPYYLINDPTVYPFRSVLIGELMGIDEDVGINSGSGSSYLISEWDYPAIGVVIASEGHTAVMLDYSACGADGEPRVVFVDTELDPYPLVCPLAPDFASFLQGLIEEEETDADQEDRAADGRFSFRTNYAREAIGDQDLAALFPPTYRSLQLIRELDISATQITDRGLPYLRPLVQLNRLNLAQLQITNQGLAALVDLPISKLNLAGTQVRVDDQLGVATLKKLGRLVGITLSEDQITTEIIQQLAREWPGLEIIVV